MSELSRSQLIVYGAIAVALLVLGARWLRSDDQPAGADGFGADAAAASPSGALEVAAGGGSMVVHVAGEVRNPGVYRLPGGSRVTDAVERAGGTTPRASSDTINLAAKLADGQQVVVPPASASGAAGVAAGEATDGPISLGSATAEDLDTIEGIGPVTAADIIAFRDERGGLSSIDDLDRVTGIGPATMDALRSRLQP